MRFTSSIHRFSFKAETNNKSISAAAADKKYFQGSYTGNGMRLGMTGYVSVEASWSTEKKLTAYSTVWDLDNTKRSSIQASVQFTGFGLIGENGIGKVLDETISATGYNMSTFALDNSGNPKSVYAVVIYYNFSPTAVVDGSFFKGTMK